jgi:two-component system response regulator FixJ
MSGTPCVYIIDDDKAVRESLGFLFESAGLATRLYASAIDFLADVGCLGYGCILTDIRMPDLDGLALQRRLVELGVALPVIIMTGHSEVAVAVQTLKAGAVDFIEKPFEDELLLQAVRNALHNSAQILEAVEAAREASRRIAVLTPREREVLGELVLGHTNKMIAYDLGASPRTIQVHRARVMEKMRVRSLPELVRMVLAVEKYHPTVRQPGG